MLNLTIFSLQIYKGYVEDLILINDMTKIIYTSEKKFLILWVNFWDLVN